MQLEMKNLMTGNKLNERFRAGEDVEKVILDEKEFQYQYDEGDTLAMMNMETYEQESFPKKMLGERIAYLTDGMDVKVCYCDDRAMDIKLPDTVILSIKETEPTVKGQTAAASYKPALLENGVRIMVPPFINTDDKIVVKTEDSTYVERVK